MEDKEIALKLVLDRLGEDAAISTVNDRMRIQKAVYICQELGVPLGYDYSWYVKGPYSPSLTRDYYSLNAALSADNTDVRDLSLNDELSEPLVRARECLEFSPDVEVITTKPHWFEALCSLHYLIRHSNKTHTQAQEYLSVVKPHLNEVSPLALTRLQAFGLA
ncbi:hypothetical protein [Loktanella sp. R86503]|uniref:hypothetical protein n=1 Tax=Loktanella sp. R86503 TaxID=3093847 RepID=UPI0036DF6F83